MITLKQLIKIAPFPDDRRKALLENLDKMNEDQKYRISNVAWHALAQMYFARLKAENDLIRDEVIHDQRKFNLNDFEEIKAKLTHEFAQKLQAAESQESVDEVKQQLEKYKTQPMPQDKTV